MEVIEPANNDSKASKQSECILSKNTEEDSILTTTVVCIACKKDHRAIAFVPCAHYITCLSCGHGMTECPVCRSTIVACVRIYE
jgi:hypothetical protein